MCISVAERCAALQVAQSEADSLRMDLAEAQTSEATLRSTLDETEGQVCTKLQFLYLEHRKGLPLQVS